MQKIPGAADAPVVNIQFNEIADKLNAAKASGERMILIHPAWQGKSWWQVLLAGRKVYEDLGDARVVLIQQETDRDLKPRWQIYASFIDFSGKT